MEPSRAESQAVLLYKPHTVTSLLVGQLIATYIVAPVLLVRPVLALAEILVVAETVVAALQVAVLEDRTVLAEKVKSERVRPQVAAPNWGDNPTDLNVHSK